MNTDKATIAALQNRIEYLEAHLRLALQVMEDLEDDSQNAITSFEYRQQSQTIDIVPTSKIELPTFLHARTWRHDYPNNVVNHVNSSDRQIAKAS